jgi:hypothetical protein
MKRYWLVGWGHPVVYKLGFATNQIDAMKSCFGVMADDMMVFDLGTSDQTKALGEAKQIISRFKLRERRA